MAERTLNDPLSGEEIKHIILNRISQAMDRDCTLIDDISYPSFTLDFDIRIKFNRSPTPGTTVWGDHKEGPPLGEKPTLNIAKDHYEEDSPNKARLDHDLPIPVEVATPTGPQKRKIRFDRPELAGKEKE